MRLSELSQVDNDFANAVKMMVIQAHLRGQAKLPMDDLINMLTRLGFSAAGQAQGIRDYVATLKNKNSDLVADVNDNEITLTTMPSDDNAAEKNAEKTTKMAQKYSRQELGL